MVAYYNEFDPFAAAWLRELIREGHIANGEVDERNIKDVQPSDLQGFDQCHFFAGIGGWSYALRLAGWPDDRPVWTGSCPCQPFSSAGKATRQSDERHLWPTWRRLIQECRPTEIFGEQVDEGVATGWLDDAFLDLEEDSYACAAANLPAYSVEAAHERMRLFFYANADDKRLQGRFSGVQENTEQRNINASIFPTLAFLKANGLNHISQPVICRPNDGLSNIVGKLRGYGNSIVPQVAAEFIKTVMEME